jgi:hypothetical protein
MNTIKQFRAALLIVVVASAPLLSVAQQTLSLKRDFVNQNKDRATISTDLRVDVHPKSPHGVGKGAEDGDIHMAGRDNIIKLPLVAEILNARFEKDTMDFLKGISDGQSVSVTGVWRVWFEHPGGEQVQGNTVPVPSSSNPDHVFELHPVTQFGAFDCLDSLIEITNPNTKPPKLFEAHSATRAFAEYESLTADIEGTAKRVLLASRKTGFNYTHFVMELAGKPKDMGDSMMVMARVFDPENPEEPLFESLRRMVFVKGSPPEKELKGLKKGDTLHVLGIPRVNFSVVMAIVNKGGTGDEPVALPYEMIIAAVLPPLG